MGAHRRTAIVAVEKGWFSNEQQHKPETVAFALTDNPLGTAAWITEKLKIWSDSPDEREPVFTKDQVLTNIMIYLVSGTPIGTSRLVLPRQGGRNIQSHRKSEFADRLRFLFPRAADPGPSPKRDRSKFQS